MQKNIHLDPQLMAGPSNPDKRIIDSCGASYGNDETNDLVYGANIAANVSPETLAKLEALKTQARIDAERGMTACQFAKNQRSLPRFVLWCGLGLIIFWGSIASFAYYFAYVA